MAKKSKIGEDPQLDLEDGKQEEELQNQGDIEVNKADAEEGQEAQETPEEVIEKLKKQLVEKDAETKAERERASKAEKERQEATQKGATHEQDAITAHETAITTALSSVETELESLESQYDQALSSGDTKTATALNRKINMALINQDKLTNRKAEIANYRENAKKQAEQKPQSQEYTESQKEWIRKHPKYETDPDYRADTNAAHVAATQRGLGVGSSSYLTFIDNYLERLHGSADEPAETRPQNNRSVTSFAAPTGRNMPTTQETKKSAPKLTPQEEALCKEMGWSPETYRANKVKAKARKEAK